MSNRTEQSALPINLLIQGWPLQDGRGNAAWLTSGKVWKMRNLCSGCLSTEGPVNLSSWSQENDATKRACRNWLQGWVERVYVCETHWSMLDKTTFYFVLLCNGCKLLLKGITVSCGWTVFLLGCVSNLWVLSRDILAVSVTVHQAQVLSHTVTLKRRTSSTIIFPSQGTYTLENQYTPARQKI